MKNKRTAIIVIFAVAVFIVTGYVYFNYPEHTIEDDALYRWISSETDYVYYRNDPAILPTSEETERAHDNFMRTKLNKHAAGVLDAEGKLPKGKEFPDSSIIIKEIYSDKTKAYELLAVMVKLKGAENSNEGWLWAEYSPSGETEYSVTKNGKVCVKCHKPGDDYVRILKILQK